MKLSLVLAILSRKESRVRYSLMVLSCDTDDGNQMSVVHATTGWCIHVWLLWLHLGMICSCLYMMFAYLIDNRGSMRGRVVDGRASEHDLPRGRSLTRSTQSYR